MSHKNNQVVPKLIRCIGYVKGLQYIKEPKILSKIKKVIESNNK